MNFRLDSYTAIFGGSFDPPHLGHVDVVSGLVKEVQVSKVIVMPTRRSPLKERASFWDRHRLPMARLAFSKLDRCEVSDLEFQRPAPSYSFDTISLLKSQHDRLAFVIGTDQLERLPVWHRFPKILGLCDWILVTRKGEDLGPPLQKSMATGWLKKANSAVSDGDLFETSHGTRLFLSRIQAREISATKIREHVQKNGEVLSGAVPLEVEAYLRSHRVYGIGAT